MEDEDEGEAQENEQEDERDGEECRMESRRVSRQPLRMNHGWDGMNCGPPWALRQCHVRHWNVCCETRENVTWEGDLFTEQKNCPLASGNCCKEVQMKVCLCALKRGHKESQVTLVPHILTRMWVPSALGNRCEEHRIKRIQKFQDRTSVPSALENRCGEHRHKKETSFKITNSKYMTKVFQNLQNKLAGVQNLPKFAVEAYETNMSFWGWFMTSSMKAAIHLEPRHNEHLEVSKIQNLKILKVYSLSQRNWYKRIQRYEMWAVSTIRALHGRDLHCSVTEQWSGWRQKYTPTRIQYGAWERAMVQWKQLNHGKAKWQLFKWRTILATGNGWRTNWIRVEKFPTIHSIVNSSQNPSRFGDIPHWTGTIQWSNPFYVHLQWQRHLQNGDMRVLVPWHLTSSTICIKLCERTLGIHWTRKRREVVSWIQLQTRWKMGFHCFQNGDKFCGNRTHLCSKGISALNRGIMRKMKSKDTIHDDGQSSNVAVTNWCETLGRTEAEKKSKFWAWIESNIIEKSEYKHWGDQFSGEDTTSTTSFGEPNASEASKFWVAFTKKSTQISLWRSRILIFSWKREVSCDTSWCWRWKRKSHSNMQGMLTSSRILLFQVFRNDQSDTKIGPVLNVHMSKLCGVHCTEVQVYRIIH